MSEPFIKNDVSALTAYGRKRNFARSPEPGPDAGTRGGNELLFVVQKHRSSRLHYDLRLETRGTLRSWAIPKGPSLNPGEKRLAMMVEDHPLGYAEFEGAIPPGNYGAGTVMVWDKGIYRPAASGSSPGDPESVDRDIRKGKLALCFFGAKLKGEFELIRMRGRGENAWLLVKKEDEFSSRTGGLFEERSVKTGRTMREIAGASVSGGEAVPPPDFSQLDFRGAVRFPMPARVSPMLATPAAEPFDRQGWLFEIKWDGYRALARIAPPQAEIYSRNGNDLSTRFPAVIASLKRFSVSAVFDGEITVVDHEGRADFQLLQNYLRTGKGALVYYVFDLLYLNGYSLENLSLRRRKQLLSRVLSQPMAHIKVSAYVENRGTALFDFVTRCGIEGIIAKDAESGYEEGRRSASWQKIRSAHRQEAVIGGFTRPSGGRKWFGSLLLGVYDADRHLVYIGRSGGGFGERELASLHGKLSARVRERSPFAGLSALEGATWVEPELVCEVRFTEWTDEGLMRHPVYLGTRPDKDPAGVTREQPMKPGRYFPVSGKHIAGEERVTIDAVEQKITNLSKVFWPAEGYTKRDLIEYYRAIAPVILPFLVDRPQSLNRHPDGIGGKSFFHKDLGGLVPGWIRTFTVHDPGSEKIVYMLCQDEAALVYMANLGCIEINPWNSRVQKPDYPDYMVLDFDPHLVSFSRVIEAALVSHELLDAIGCANFCKSSGATGMHIYVPLGTRYPYAQARGFAELVSRIVNERLPATTSVERMPVKRERRVYLDFLQNARGKTMAAPFSVRPRERATVSCPLFWEEVDERFDPAEFTIRTMTHRLDGRVKLWRGVLGPGVDLMACLKRLARLYKERIYDGDDCQAA